MIDASRNGDDTTKIEKGTHLCKIKVFFWSEYLFTFISGHLVMEIWINIIFVLFMQFLGYDILWYKICEICGITLQKAIEEGKRFQHIWENKSKSNDPSNVG